MNEVKLVMMNLLKILRRKLPMTGLYERELWALTNQAEGLHPEPRTPPSIYFFRLLEENVSQAPPESSDKFQEEFMGVVVL